MPGMARAQSRPKGVARHAHHTNVDHHLEAKKKPKGRGIRKRMRKKVRVYHRSLRKWVLVERWCFSDWVWFPSRRVWEYHPLKQNKHVVVVD